MKTTAALLVAVAAVAAAQQGDEYDVCQEDGQAFCAGGSLSTDIIIRCSGEGKGVAGRCSNNLVGQPPLGSFPSLCYQTSAEAGDAACEKNCVVYADEPFTLPASVCTPFFTASSSSSSSTAPPGSSSTGVTEESSTTSEEPEPTETSTLVTTVGPTGGNGTCTSCTPTQSTEEPTTVPTVPVEGGAAGLGVGVAALVGVVAWVL